MLRRRWLRGRRGICHLTVRGRYDAVVLYLMLFVWGGGSCESSRCAGRRGVHSVDSVVVFVGEAVCLPGIPGRSSAVVPARMVTGFLR